MKFHFEIINKVGTGSVYNVHMYAIYEGSDCAENLDAVLQPYRDDFIKIQNNSFELCGHKIKLFVGGRYSF